MGTYKVPQNVEAEDKILGPLSLKQFIYALIGIGYGFLTFAIFKSVIVLWVLIGLPPALALLALGLYQRDDQPLETFVVAVIQFFARPKKRFWDKEPIAEVFRLEPPPPKPEIEKRDPTQVRSQLQKLANVVDTRGWNPKDPELQEPEEVPVVDLQDRLGTEPLTTQPIIAPAPVVTHADDILASDSTASANLNVLIENSVKSIRAEALTKMKQRPAAPAAPPRAKTTSGSTAAPSGDILKLATEGGDLTVAQIAAQARKRLEPLTEGQTVDLRNAKPTAS